MGWRQRLAGWIGGERKMCLAVLDIEVTQEGSARASRARDLDLGTEDEQGGRDELNRLLGERPVAVRGDHHRAAGHGVRVTLLPGS